MFSLLYLKFPQILQIFVFCVLWLSNIIDHVGGEGGGIICHRGLFALGKSIRSYSINKVNDQIIQKPVTNNTTSWHRNKLLGWTVQIQDINTNVQNTVSLCCTSQTKKKKHVQASKRKKLKIQHFHSWQSLDSDYKSNIIFPIHAVYVTYMH